MDIFGFILAVAPVAFGAVGTWFLVKEVDHAHRFEALSREMNEVQKLLYLFQTNLREFWVRSAMLSFNRDRARVEEMANHLSDADIQTEAANYRQFWEKRVAESLDRWSNHTAHTQLERRRRMLWTGFGLIMVSAAITILASAAEHMGKFNGH